MSEPVWSEFWLHPIDPPKRAKLRLKQNAWWMVLLIVAFICWLAIRSAVAHDAKDPAMNDWTMVQKNQNNGNCCNGDDAFVLGDNEWRTVNGHYEILHEGKWMEVPAYAMIKRGEDSPTSSAIVWIWNNHPHCFKTGTLY